MTGCLPDKCVEHIKLKTKDKVWCRWGEIPSNDNREKFRKEGWEAGVKARDEEIEKVMDKFEKYHFEEGSDHPSMPIHYSDFKALKKELKRL